CPSRRKPGPRALSPISETESRDRPETAVDVTARDLCELTPETTARLTDRVEAREDRGSQERAPGVAVRGLRQPAAAHLSVSRRKWLPKRNPNANTTPAVGGAQPAGIAARQHPVSGSSAGPALSMDSIKEA